MRIHVCETLRMFHETLRMFHETLVHEMSYHFTKRSMFQLNVSWTYIPNSGVSVLLTQVFLP